MKNLTNNSAKKFAGVATLVLSLFMGATSTAQGAGNSCMVMTQCPGTGQSNATPVYRYAGVDVYQRQDDSGGATTFARKPDCNLQPGQCLVTVRDKDGNTVNTYLSRGLDAGAARASPIPQEITKTSTPYTPVDPARMPGGSSGPSQDTILYSPTRMFGAFYQSYSDYQTPIPSNDTPRSTLDSYRELYREFAQPPPEPPPPPEPRGEIIPTGGLSSESVHLEPTDNSGNTTGRSAAVGGNSATTFVDPDIAEIAINEAVTDKSVVATDENSGSSENSFSREIEARYALANVRDVPVIADASWVDDPHTPLLRDEVRGNLVRATDDLEYLKQLDHNELCTSQCQSDVVNRENQLRILHALDDQMTHGYSQVISLQNNVGGPQTETDVSGATRYLVTLQDARGETFYCNSSGACTPSDTFVPAEPRRNPIAVAAAPVEIERVASRLSFANSPVYYAFAELSGSGASVFQQIISPSTAFTPRADYPPCSLLTSLIGSCANWQ